MIDCENEVYTRLKNKILEEYPDTDISGVYDNIPSSFPYVFIEMTSNIMPYRSENDVANMMFTIDVYSDKTYGRKEECKAILAIVDREMFLMNFRRTAYSPVPNRDNPSIFRVTTRYEGATDGKAFYRR